MKFFEASTPIEIYDVAEARVPQLWTNRISRTRRARDKAAIKLVEIKCACPKSGLYD